VKALFILGLCIVVFTAVAPSVCGGSFLLPLNGGLDSLWILNSASLRMSNAGIYDVGVIAYHDGDSVWAVTFDSLRTLLAAGHGVNVVDTADIMTLLNAARDSAISVSGMIKTGSGAASRVYATVSTPNVIQAPTVANSYTDGVDALRGTMAVLQSTSAEGGAVGNTIHFRMINDGGDTTTYAGVGAWILDNTDGTEDGQLYFMVTSNGSEEIMMTIDSGGFINTKQGAIDDSSLVLDIETGDFNAAAVAPDVDPSGSQISSALSGLEFVSADSTAGDVDTTGTAIGAALDDRLSRHGDDDGMGDTLAMNGNRITEVGSPTEDDDAATKAYVDDLDLNKSGPFIIGDMEITGNINKWNQTTSWDTTWAWADHADTPLHIDLSSCVVSYNADSSHIAHVDVAYIPTGWNSWKYVIALTPLGENQAQTAVHDLDENPCIYVSNNGEYWLPFIGIDSVRYVNNVEDGTYYYYNTADTTDSIACQTWAYNSKGDYDSSRLAIIWGDTVDNPIVYPVEFADSTGRDTVLAADTIWNGPDTLTSYHMSDVDLELFTDRYMYLFWRTTYETQGGTSDRAQAVWVARSIDGVTWTDTTRLFWVADSTAQVKPFFISPSVILDTGGVFSMYYTIRADADTMVYGDNDTLEAGEWMHVVRRQSATPLDSSSWSEYVDTCMWDHDVLDVSGQGMTPWHLNVVKVGDEYHALVVYGKAGDLDGQNATLFLSKSKDGLYWDTKYTPVLASNVSDAWDDGLIYRSGMVPVDMGNSKGYELWYPSLNGTEWNLGHSYVQFTKPYEMYHLSNVGQRKGNSDSVYTSTPFFDDDEGQDEMMILFRDTALDASVDNHVGVSGYAVNDILADTLLFRYKTTGEIDSVLFFIPQRDESGVTGLPYGYHADSMVVDTNINLTAGSFTTVKIPLGGIPIYQGERMTAMFYNVFADDADYVSVAFVAVKGRPKSAFNW
jgi:hypothetical protein